VHLKFRVGKEPPTFQLTEASKVSVLSSCNSVPSRCYWQTDSQLRSAILNPNSDRRVSLKLSIVVAILLMSPALAFADLDPCQSGSIANLLAQGPCTIGDLTFDFTGYTGRNAYSPEFYGPQIQFAPISGGFELTDFENVFINPTNDCQFQCLGTAFLYYTVTTNPPGLDGVSISGGGLLNTSPGGEGTSAVADYDISNLGASVSGSQSVAYGEFPISTYANDPASFPPVQSASGYVEVYDDTSLDYITSGPFNNDPSAGVELGPIDFTFSEAPVPEPTPVFLLATVGALLIVPVRRCKGISRIGPSHRTVLPE